MAKLSKWAPPDSYFGAEWPDYFVFLGQHRESDSLTRSNFECGLNALGGESDSVIVVRERHWAVGWVEWIAIHESDVAALEKANAIYNALDSYPVVNEDHWANLESEEAEKYWATLPISERVELCADHGVSIYAARHDWVPSNDGSLDEYLRG